MHSYPSSSPSPSSLYYRLPRAVVAPLPQICPRCQWPHGILSSVLLRICQTEEFRTRKQSDKRTPNIPPRNSLLEQAFEYKDNFSWPLLSPKCSHSKHYKPSQVWERFGKWKDNILCQSTLNLRNGGNKSGI